MRRAGPPDLTTLVELEQASAYHPWSNASLSCALTDRHTRVWLDPHAYCIERSVLDEGEIHTIGVHPDHRRQGHARRMLAHVHAYWTRIGVTRAFLEVREANAPARALYRSLGWRENGRRANYYGPGEDAICMEWSTP